MAKKKGVVGRSRGKVKGKASTPIGEGEFSSTPVGEILSIPYLFDDATNLNGLGLDNQHDHMVLRNGSTEGFDEKVTENLRL